MRYRSKKLSVVLGSAAGATVLGMTSGKAMAQYAVTNSFTVPYTAVDPYNANPSATVGYTSIANISDPTTPTGGMPGPVLVGDIYNSSAGVGTAFAYTTTGVHLIGAYTETSNNTRSTLPSVTGTNTYGQVIGYQSQNSNSNSSTGLLGYESWLATPNSSGGYTSAFLSGLTTPYHGYTKSVDSFGDTGFYSYTNANKIASNGNVAGVTLRYEGDTAASPSTSLGTSAWLFTPSSVNSNNGSTSSSNYTEIGLTGSGNSYSLTFNNASSGTNTQPYYSNSIAAVSATSVAGSANVYSGNGSSGLYSSSVSDAWIYNSGATAALGGLYLTSSNSSVTGTMVLSATNNGNNLSFTVPAPTVTPTSGSFQGNLSYGFITTFATYKLGNTIATAVARNSGVVAINDAGQVGLTTSYYVNNAPTATGTDAFIYTPSTTSPGTGTYVQVGLTTDSLAANTYSNTSNSFVSYNGRRSTSISFLNANGASSGTSSTYIGNTQTGTGQAAWVASASGATTQIGLSNTTDTSGNQIHQTVPSYPAGVTGTIYNDYVSAMNNAGMVAGYSNRYQPGVSGTQIGQDAWVYDPNHIDTIPGQEYGTNMWIVDPADEGTTNYTSSQIYYLSPNGVAVGRYANSSSTASSGVYNAFIWSESSGFEPLTTASLSVSGLSAAGYQALINAFYSDSPGNTIIGTGAFTQASNAQPNGLVTLTGAVPEPTSLTLVGLGGIGLLRRRRRPAMSSR
jgi:hypothetical protein